MIPGCDLFEEKGDINDYVGVYYLETANERTYHVYWGSEKITGERTLIHDSFHLTINEDKTVIITDKDGKETKGRIKCLKDYCRFYSTPLESSYKFYRRYDNCLYYSYESKHMSVEYDVTYRSIILRKEN